MDCLGEVITPTAMATDTGAVVVAGPDAATVPTVLSASSDPRMRRRVELIWSDSRRVARLSDMTLVAWPVEGAALPLSPAREKCKDDSTGFAEEGEKRSTTFERQRASCC